MTTTTWTLGGKEVQLPTIPSTGRMLLLMDDFNYPDIANWLTSCRQTTASQNFADCIEDKYLTQHVNEATCKRSRFSESEITDTVSVLGPFGYNDHNIFEWTVDPKIHQSDQFCSD